MAWTSGFFNSVNGDRTYNAEQLSTIFEGLITNGVYESIGNKLAVQPNSGMVIQVATGRGWFGNHWVKNDSPYLQTLEAADVLLNRYCAVCVRVDEAVGSRSANVYLKYSEFATSPVKPTMERSETVKEYCLAYVYIKAGATAITAADIEDTRSNNSLCGWVTGLIKQIDINTMYEQQKALFTQWFEGLVDIIDSDVETTLVSAMPVNTTVTLQSSGWTASGSTYVQDITIAGMTETKSIIVMPEDTETYAKAEISASGQTTNTVTFSAVTKPTENIKVKMLYMGT